jgi:hypothetical protein
VPFQVLLSETWTERSAQPGCRRIFRELSRCIDWQPGFFIFGGKSESDPCFIFIRDILEPAVHDVVIGSDNIFRAYTRALFHLLKKGVWPEIFSADGFICFLYFAVPGKALQFQGVPLKRIYHSRVCCCLFDNIEKIDLSYGARKAVFVRACHGLDRSLPCIQLSVVSDRKF